MSNDNIIIDIRNIEGMNHSFSIPDKRMVKPFGVISKVDKNITFLQNTNTINFKDTKICLATPNSIALSLNIYTNNLKEAISIKNKFLELNKDESIFKENVGMLYDYIEKIQIAIVFAYQAIETFSNHYIPDDFKYEKINHKKIKEIYSKNEIERWIPTSEKISDIIPKIMKINSPRKELFWKDFKAFEEIRNEIIHRKDNIKFNLFSILFDDDIVKIINSGLSVLNYFIKFDKDNVIFPFGFGESRMEIIEVDDIRKYFEKIKD